MKPFSKIITALLGIFLIMPQVDARGERSGGKGGGGGGRAQAASQNRSGGGDRRSPMTASKIQRPEVRPAPRPAARPQQRPEARPIQRPAARPVERPQIQKPTLQKPVTRPETRPAQLPNKLPNNRPETKPAPLPGKLPGARPETKPAPLPGRLPADRPQITRPDTRPSFNRPDGNKPTTLPGMVTYPNRPANKLPGDRPNIDRDKINVGDRNNIHIDNINVGRRNVGLNRPSTLPAKTRDWDNKKWGGNNGIWGNGNNIGNNVNINIDRNFQMNNNFSYRPNYWGANPWWGAGHCHTWHHGHWGYGWNSGYYHRHWWYDDDDDFASGFMWGIAVWSLGNMIYDMGYHTYKNPYPAPPVQNTYITYAQPVSVAAAANPPGDEASAKLAETKSNEALERSRVAFRKGDYLTASKAVDEALAFTPSDVTLHEYRALVFFSLGKYADATGVLNPVLASGPGWSWDTMIGLYGASATYEEQLRKLEAHVKSTPDKADGHFLLGYHYMVCGHMEKSLAEFEATVRLQPADSIARQLRDLTKNSIPDGGESEAAPEVAPPPVPLGKLVGTWVSDRGADGKVTFTMKESGDYTWSFMNAGQTSELKGTYGLNDKGLLVLTSDDSQMVSAITLDGDSKLHFVLIGAPDGDPGLDFTKG